MSIDDDLRPKILTGIPAGTKPTGGWRVDFKIHLFDNLIAVKGQRYWWSRRALCPCRGNIQTDQIDPTCTMCKGSGFIWFLPEEALRRVEQDSNRNPIELNEDETAVSVPVLLVGIEENPRLYERFGSWIQGDARGTTLSTNRLGYRDRLQARDVTLPYSQLIDCDGGTEIMVRGSKSTSGLWTPVKTVNLLRSAATVFRSKEHFEVTETGTIKWLLTPPPAGTLLTVHAEFSPVWIVIGMPRPARDTMVAKKAKTLTAEEQYKRMPVQVTLRLDFLVDETLVP